MNRVDKKKHITQNVTQSINFEKVVLEALETRARKQGIKVSKLVNFVCKQIVLGDAEYFRFKKKQAWLDFQEFKYMEEQAKIKQEMKE